MYVAVPYQQKFTKLWEIPHPVHKIAGNPSPSPWKWGESDLTWTNLNLWTESASAEGASEIFGL